MFAPRFAMSFSTVKPFLRKRLSMVTYRRNLMHLMLGRLSQVWVRQDKRTKVWPQVWLFFEFCQH